MLTIVRPLAAQVSEPSIEHLDAFLREIGTPDYVIDSMPLGQKLLIYEELRNNPDAVFAFWEEGHFYVPTGTNIFIFRYLFNWARIILLAFLFFGLIIFIAGRKGK